MQKENINITVNGEVKSPIELILREGQAGPIVEPLKIAIDGVITAPREFAKQISDKSKSVVQYSFWDKYVEIFENPTSKYGARVRGDIKLNPDFVAFAINKDKYQNSKNLINFVRKYAHCFKNITEAKELINSLRNFEVSFEKTHVKSDDRKGNTEDSVKNAVKYSKGEVKSELVLSMPLFLGAPNVDFNVEVEIEVEGNTPVFGFYSLDLEVLLRQQVEYLINEEISILSKEFTCIQLS